jgi:hypothetical protein
MRCRSWPMPVAGKTIHVPARYTTSVISTAAVTKRTLIMRFQSHEPVTVLPAGIP